MSLQQNPFLYPTLYVFALYGVRYLAMASLTWLFARPTPQGGWGRPHAQVPTAFNARRHIGRELVFSVLSLAVFGLVNGVLWSTGALRHSLIYLHFSAYPAWWFVLSIPAMVVLHDTFFYWAHRAMHTRWLYARVHKLHHQSVHPTAFAAYSFHPWEALVEALITVPMLFIIPSHPLAILIFQTFSTAYNVYGHCGREFYGAGMAQHPVGRWINTSTSHATHHLRGRHNYSFYFLFWDRWMGTLAPETPAPTTPKPAV